MWAVLTALGVGGSAWAQHATVNYEYDALGRVTKATYGDGAVINYAYDAAGNRTSTSSAAPPTAVNDSVTPTEDTALTFDPRSNDTGQNLTITAKTNGTKGSVAIVSGTQLTYTPSANATGADTFTYTISNGVLTDEGTVTVTITAVNDAPDAVNDTLGVLFNTAKTFDPRTNDTDIEGTSLTITAKTNGTKGTVAIVSGTQLTYTPNAGASGADSFTYTISDGGLTDTATVSVTISTDAPPDAVNDAITTNEDTAKTFDPRTNDTEPNGQTMTITAKTNGTKGTVAIVGGTQLTYTPNANANGADSFTYTISDGSLTDTATVSVTITAVNDAPNAVNDSISVTYQTAKTFDPRTNDTDVEGSALTITAKTNGSKGTVTIVSGTQLTYTPNAGAYGTDSFTYTISDGGLTDTATVSVNIPATVIRQANGTLASGWSKAAITLPGFNPPFQQFVEVIYLTSDSAVQACNQMWVIAGSGYGSMSAGLVDSIFDCGYAGSPAVPGSGGVLSGYFATGNGREIVKP